MQRKVIPLVCLLLVSALPAVPAEWRVHGTIEPDTIYDAEDGFMWTTPDHDPDPSVRYIYFNAVGNLYTTAQNPNSEITGSRILWFPFQNPMAYLGVWKDCNGDGYIGMAAGALTEYRAQLLLNDAICPPESDFNDGEWVYEFLWIHPGWRPATTRATPVERGIEDRDAYVWGDAGLPGQPAMAHLGPCEVLQSTSLTTAITLPFEGFTASTGAMIQYADCWTNRAGAQALLAVDHALGLGIAFEDPEHPERSSSPLNQHLPLHPYHDPNAPEGHERGFYDREDDTRAASVWNCDAPDTATARDPTGSGGRGSLSAVTFTDPTQQLWRVDPDFRNETTLNLTDEEGRYARVPALAPAVHDPAGNWYGAVNHTERGTTNPTPDQLATGRHDACEDYAAERGSSRAWGTWGLAHIEGPPARDDDTLARRYNDYPFFFLKHMTDARHFVRNETRTAFQGLGNGTLSPTLGDEINATAAIVLPALGVLDLVGRDAPANGGLDAHRHSALVGPSWTGSFRSTKIPIIDRHSLQPAGPIYETFYARVGSASLAVGQAPPSAPATYGSDWCGSATSGVVRQFDCDPDNWWNLEYDPTSRQNRDSDNNGNLDGVVPGWPYHLRDIDCKDNSLARAAPVSLSELSEEGGCVWPEPPQ